LRWNQGDEQVPTAHDAVFLANQNPITKNASLLAHECYFWLNFY